MYKIKALIPQSLKNLYHLAQAVLANIIYGFPSHNIKVIGVTGTDGKTTTVQMITKIFQEAGKKVAMASTINFVIDGVEEKNLSHFTTESAFALQKFISKAASAGCEYLVLETSSHSLDQHRVWGIEFQTAVITNITREHLDYHGTMEKYREAKGKLFKSLKSNFKFSILNFQSIFNDKILNNTKTSVVNFDMEYLDYFLNFDADKKYAFTCHSELDSESGFRVKPGMTTNGNIKIVQAENIELNIGGSEFKIYNFLPQAYPREKFKINLPGLFNVENALAATCVALGEGIGLETIKEALEKIRGVAGRMESVENTRGLNILVDFALTPNALERLYKLLVSVKKEDAKIIAVFGSCGDRDRGKRPIMGKMVSKYADIVILTNDEPYHEDPQGIIDEIFAGVIGNHENKIDESIINPNFQFPISNFQSNPNDQISKTKIGRVEGVNCFRILDRREAIAKALEIAKAGDIVCVTGMGNFESMVVGDKKIPWNDKKVIQEELEKLI